MRNHFRSPTRSLPRPPRANRAQRMILECLEGRELLSGFGFTDFSNASGLNLRGNASVTSDNRLRLTPALNLPSVGGAWYVAEKSLVAGSFETSFRFQLRTATGGSDGSHGFAFVIQNSSSSELRAGGAELGYDRMPNSVAIEFDTKMGGDDPSQSHISVHTNGTGDNSISESYSLGFYNTQGFILDDGQVHTAKVNYAVGSMSIYLDDLTTPILNVSIDLAETLDLDLGRAWVGFTGAVAPPDLTHDILDWNFQSDDNLIVANSPSILEGAVGSTATMTFTINRMGNLSGGATVGWTTSNGTASAGTDYAAASGQVSFMDGQSQKSIQVPVYGDDNTEAHESFRLFLSTSASYTTIAGKGTVLNDDTTVTISDDLVVEGATGYRFIDPFVMANDGGLDHGRAVIFGPDGNIYVGHLGFAAVLRYDGKTGRFIDIFADGRGQAGGTSQIIFHNGNLFASIGGGILRFDGATGAPLPAPGKTGATFVTPGDGNLLKGGHALAFGPDGHVYVTSTHTNEILRFDGSSGAFLGAYVSSGSGGLSEPNALTFGEDGRLYVGGIGSDAVHRYRGPSEPSPGGFVDNFVSPGSGGLNSMPSGGLQFGPGGDLYISDRDASSVLRYNGSTGAFIGVVVSPGQGGISKAGGFTFDAAGRLYVSSQDSNQVLRYGPATEAVLTVTLSHPSALPITVKYATGNGTALAGGDYTADSGTITFAPGETSRTILVQTADDPVYEGNETFAVSLSSAVGATIIDGQGVATIVDDDTPPTKFYVVEDASTNRTYEYGATGSAVENYGLNAGNTAPRGAASTLVGDKVWVVDANKKVYVYNTGGGLLGSWSAGSLASNATVEGITTNGTDVWIVDAKSDKVFRYTGAASRLSGSQNAASSFNLNSGNTTPKDVVTDGSSLWVVNDSSTDKVFKYSLSGSLLGSWTITGAGSSPTGITLDPAGGENLWIVDNGTDRVYQFDNARTRTSGSQSPSTSFALAAGNANPQGIADPPMPAVGTPQIAASSEIPRPSRHLAAHHRRALPRGSASKSISPFRPSIAVSPSILGQQATSILLPSTSLTGQDLISVDTERFHGGKKRSRITIRG